MPLPEGRKPLSDKDMIVLLHDIARAFARDNDNELSSELRQTADRLSELSEKENSDAPTYRK